MLKKTIFSIYKTDISMVNRMCPGCELIVRFLYRGCDRVEDLRQKWRFEIQAQKIAGIIPNFL